MIQDKSAFFDAVKKKTIEIKIPDTDQTVTFNELSVKDRQDYFELQSEVGLDLLVLPAFVVCRSCPLLDDEDMERVQKEFSAECLVYFSREVLILSGMLKGSIEDAEKK